MFDNSEIKTTGGYLEAGIHTVHVFNIESEETFINRNGENRKKVKVMFKGETGEAYFEDFLIMDSTMWRLKIFSMACGIGADDKWEWKDLIGRQLRIHLKEVSYTDKNGEKKMRTELYKFESYNPETESYTEPEPINSDPF